MQARARELSSFPLGDSFFCESWYPGPSQASRKGVVAKGPRPLVSVPEADLDTHTPLGLEQIIASIRSMRHFI